MFAHTSSSVFPGRQLLVTTVIELNAMYTACILQYTFLFFVFCERSLSYAVYYLLLYFSVEQIEVCMQRTRVFCTFSVLAVPNLALITRS